MLCYFKDIEFLYFRKNIFESRAALQLECKHTAICKKNKKKSYNFGRKSFKALQSPTEKRGLRVA